MLIAVLFSRSLFSSLSLRGLRWKWSFNFRAECTVIIEQQGNYTGAMIFSGITITAGSLLTFAPVMWKRGRERFGSRKRGDGDEDGDGGEVGEGEGEKA